MFWELSLGEVIDLIDAYNKTMMENRKFEILTKQIQAVQIFEHISVLLDKDNAEKITPIWDFYPYLFADEKKANEQLQLDEELERVKDGRKIFAANYNSRIGSDVK